MADAAGEMSFGDWQQNLANLGAEEGFFDRLGAQHSALYIERGRTLIVTFENLDHVYERGVGRLPWGHAYVRDRDWSMLGLMAHDWTWYRDAAVFDFFDNLRDTGFFSRFERVVFYGASMGAYAAAVFSAACPGADVIAISPQATLDRDIASWETRYRKGWVRDWTGRYAYAPEQVSAARRFSMFWDPHAQLDAMHASLFRSPNVARFRCRFMGHRIASLWQGLGILQPIIDGCVDGSLDKARFHALIAARKQSGRYQRELLAQVKARGKPRLAAQVCEYVLARRRAPHFRAELRAARAQIGAP